MFMTIFIITTLKDNQDGVRLGFDAKSDFGSPSQHKLQMLREYLTQKGLDLLLQILATQLGQFGKPAPENPSAGTKA
jgi:hypothetical protein